MSERRQLHTGDIAVSKDTVKAIAAREKEKSDLAKTVEKAAKKSNAEESKRA